MAVIAKWRVLVFLAGDNDLESFGAADLAEMKRVGSGDDVHVLAQFDRAGPRGATRYRLRNATSLEEDEVEDIGQSNTGDPATLLEFVRWAHANYPAKRTALVLWNHGAGWKDDDIYGRVRAATKDSGSLPSMTVRNAQRPALSRMLFTSAIDNLPSTQHDARAVLFDDGARDFLDNLEMKKVVDAIAGVLGRRLDVIGFDACLMSMVEVAAQVVDGAEIMVASQEVEPGDGWPYGDVLSWLRDHAACSGPELASAIVDLYGRHYEQPAVAQRDLTQSATRLDGCSAVAGAVDLLAERLIEAMTQPTFMSDWLKVFRRVRKFRDSQYVDLGHLAQLLAGVPWAAVNEAADGLSAILVNDGPVLLRRWSASNDPPAHGLSIYLPGLTPPSPLYAGLQFAQTTRWPQFIERFANG